MRNFYHTIIINIHRIIFYLIKSNIWLRHAGKHSVEERYALANEMVTCMNKSSGYKTIAYGYDNLPKEGGYMLYPNHQGKYDVLGIFNTHKSPISFVMDEKRSHLVLVSEFLRLVDGKTISLNDPRHTITVFNEMAEELKQGKKFILFPEGGYKENNGNVVTPFKAGSFKVAQMSKVPIVPVALIDSYKVYNSDHVGPVTTYVYYLDPISYDEYKGMRSHEIAAMVEKIIKDKIAEHLSNNKENYPEVVMNKLFAVFAAVILIAGVIVFTHGELNKDSEDEPETYRWMRILGVILVIIAIACAIICKSMF